MCEESPGDAQGTEKRYRLALSSLRQKNSPQMQLTTQSSGGEFSIQAIG